MEVKLKLSTTEYRSLFEIISKADFNQVPDKDLAVMSRHILAPVFTKLSKKAIAVDSCKLSFLTLKEAEARAMKLILQATLDDAETLNYTTAIKLIGIIDQKLV